MPPNHLILCRPLLLPPSVFPSIRVFSNESVLRIRWTKYWNFSISPSNEYSGLISWRMDWLDLLAVHRTLKSLLQHPSSKASILRLSFLYSPALTFVLDYWKNHSFDYTHSEECYLKTKNWLLSVLFCYWDVVALKFSQCVELS